ncbi:DUF4105 domain-containing protein [Pseudomonas neustonica]|uniref:DUF4105 domain-containing protein n=1 Tax=Pseudomonas neustonica TaxID=2487346 RepID=A0ABX9XHN8_9PSED|nr:MULTISPECIES: DUF4105 domain-containing protein [Pseudomonas]ROZ84171.1 DUF4105 domain-containing protein [Pseudomonas sp. SSM44]ROZ84418.1 DUF4105 domain-containing protein [Pseudomonas neustonica]
MFKRLAPLLIGSLCAAAQASPQMADTQLQALASERYWLLLGHYLPSRLDGWRSYVDDDAFFLADEGATSPTAELQATLDGLYADPAQGNDHVQCKYPARTRWLREQLQLSDLPSPDCGEYRSWYDDINPHATVLVFPDAYLNSPSSMFGHTLLRIDSPDTQASGTTLLTYALNFGAMVENMDNGILYAWKGLAGGYPGQFSLLPYRDKIGEYSRLENRDLWEYQLNLTPEETARMVEHVWELRQVRFDYFFFDENCSYRLLELLEVAKPQLHLTEQFPLTAIPADTVRAVREAGLITDVTYRPSRERELLAQAEPLTSNELDWVTRLAADSAVLKDPDYQAIDSQRQALIQESAYRLIRYQSSGQERDQASADRSYQLLQAINQNPPPKLLIDTPTYPEYGHESRTWQLALGSRDDRAFAEYGLRLAYHDLADNLAGFPLGAQIELGTLNIRQYQGNHWQLEELGLVSIRSLTPRNQLLKPWSWQVATGLERVAGDDDKRRLVPHLNGGGGFSWNPVSDLQTFALATLRVEHHPDADEALSPAAGFNAGLLWRNGLGNLLMETSNDFFTNGEVRRSLKLSQHWELGTDLGLRLRARREFSHRSDPENEVSLQLRWYYY